MAFTQETFATVGAQAAPTLTVYAYNTSDTLVEVTTSGYFADKVNQFEEGDIIMALINGSSAILSIDSNGDAVVIFTGGSATGDNIVEVSATYLIALTDDYVVGTNTIDIDLIPFATAVQAVTIINDGVGTLTVDPDGAETIDGLATLALGPSASRTIIPISTGWISV